MPFSYIELHARSAFSFLRGACVPEDYAFCCSELDQKGMALLDIDGILLGSSTEGALRLRAASIIVLGVLWGFVIILVSISVGISHLA